MQRAYDAIMPINPQLVHPAVHRRLSGRRRGTRPARDRDAIARRSRTPSIGFSAHDNGIAMALVAYMLGARIIEKHFTLNRAWKGTDHAFSLEPAGMRKLVRDLQRARMALGDGVKRVYAIRDEAAR